MSEGLRLHCPADGSLLYQVLEDIKVCNVPIPQDSLLRINFSSLHYDSLNWHEPKSFLPERFDPESEYYLRPGSSKSRLIESFIPFGVGDRHCPGKSMSYILLKVWIVIVLPFLSGSS